MLFNFAHHVVCVMYIGAEHISVIMINDIHIANSVSSFMLFGWLVSVLVWKIAID